MIVRHIFAAALIAPFLTVSGMAQEVPAVTKHIYVGGPKSDIPHTTRSVSNWEQAYAKAPRAKAKTTHRYQGGPNTVVPHSN